MKILLAPNAFKESLTAIEILSILHEQFTKIAPDIKYQLFPLSDGGDGFIDIIAYHEVLPKREIEAALIMGKKGIVDYIYDEMNQTVFIESASIIGLRQIPAPERDVLSYNSYALGAFIKQIATYLKTTSKTAKKVIIGVGGTATIDLGLGAALALTGEKWKTSSAMFDSDELAQAIVNKGIKHPQIELVLDVLVPVLGGKDMISEFGGQKGLKAEQAPLLRNSINKMLDQIFLLGGKDYRDTKLGAGGGLAVGFDILAPVIVTNSSDFIWDFLDLHSLLPDSDLVITSEGKLDRTSLLNKGTSVLIQKCSEYQKRLIIICGSADEGVRLKLELEGIWVFELKDYFDGGIIESISRAEEGLRKCAVQIFDGLK